MLIDGFTVFAQIINFLILIWLMNRFLFKPIRAAMAQREKAMADALNRAEQAEAQAKTRIRELEKEKRALEAARERLMAEAREAVDGWREEAIKAVQDEMETLRRAWMANMTRDRETFLDGLKQRLVRQVVGIGEKVLRDLADQQLNQQVLRIFLQKVSSQKETLSHQVDKRGVRVRSGVPLDDDGVQMLQDQLFQWFSECPRFQVEAAPELGFGIQLVVGDRQTGWHLADYLRELEGEMMATLTADGQE